VSPKLAEMRARVVGTAEWSSRAFHRFLIPTVTAACRGAPPEGIPYGRDRFVLLHPGRRFFSMSAFASASPSPDSMS